jgi:DNA-directed RNA polymerase specialized sigma24 family protein
MYGVACKCGQEYVLSWKCRCGEINTNYKCKCGFDMGKGVRNRKLERLLSRKVKDSNRSALARLRQFVTFTAYKHRIPEIVAEEAWSITLENIVIGINKYDPDKGEFMHWAFRVARNALMSASRNSVAESEKLGPSLDYLTEDGELTAETITDNDESALDLLIEKEARQKETSEMTSIASFNMGKCSVTVNGEEVERQLFDVCVEAYAERGHGWINLVSYRTGIPSHQVSRRKNKAKKALQQWQERQAT